MIIIILSIITIGLVAWFLFSGAKSNDDSSLAFYNADKNNYMTKFNMNMPSKGFTPKASAVNAYLRKLIQGEPIKNKSYMTKLFDNGFLSAQGVDAPFFSRQGGAYTVR